MGHEIKYLTYPYNCDKRKVANEISDWVRKKCWEEGGGMIGSIRWIDSTVYNSYDSAHEAISTLERGSYDQLAVPYKQLPVGASTKKIETLKTKIREVYSQLNALEREVVVKSFKAQLVTCKKCGSKLNKDYLNSNFCPLCRTDMRSETTQARIASLRKKHEELQKALLTEEEILAAKKGQIVWLVKIEYHM